MLLKEVITQEDHQKFLNLSLFIYKEDANWIQPLDKDLESVFTTNKLLKRGKLIRWILLDDQQKVIGRIAAFINPLYRESIDAGGCGFFECINDQKAANILFDAAKNWLLANGKVAMDGPINFGERDKWWGLLLEGFHEPLYCMNYNPPYYQTLFEQYGFQVYFYQECFGRGVHQPLPPKFQQRYDDIKNMPGLKAIHIRKNQLEKFAKDFCIVYNDAWTSHGGGKSMTDAQAISIFNAMKMAMDEQVVWFAYLNDHPIAFWVNLPDMNQYFKSFKGKLGWLEKLKFLYKKYTQKNNRLVGIVFGVVKAYQGKGIDNFMIQAGTNHIRKHTKYESYELQWIGDFNPKMLGVAVGLDTVITRKLATYRYIFDRNSPFKRHPIIG